MIGGRSFLAKTLASTFALIAAGCVSERVERTSSRFILPEPGIPAGPGPTDSSGSLRWNSIGFVEYDDFTIPLISPDGSRLVSRSGAPPGWEEILANPSSTPLPDATFSIHSIDDELGLGPPLEIRGPWILGRCADRNGFLIEEPRDDGSRRIGRVDWITQDISWLVDDGEVAAFAFIDRDGTIAYSRRDVDDEAFDLVLRRGDGSGVWEIPSRWGRSWIDPVLAPDGRTLFALCRGDGTVELAWTRTTGESRFRDGIRTHPISIRTTPRRVQAMLGPQVGASSPPATKARIIFLHPDLARLVEWSPGTDLARPFPEGTINATMLGEDMGIAATREGIEYVRLSKGVGQPPTSLSMTEDTAIPRRLGEYGQDSRFVLLRPDAGRYEVIIGDLSEQPIPGP